MGETWYNPARPMNNDLEIILSNLRELLNQARNHVRPPYLYLDPEAALHLFQDLTGLTDMPRIWYFAPKGGQAGRAEVSLEPGPGNTVPIHILFEAMGPILEQKVPLVGRAEDLAPLVHRYARVQGLMQSTHFPDGNLNLEIEFAGVRGLLFFTRSFFSSVVRPFLDHDRIHTLFSRVEALVYAHGEVQRTIFYHQTYGDNREHDWLPLAPVAIRKAENTQETPGVFC